MFERVPERELMDAADQVAAYAAMDFSEAHDRLIQELAETFPDSKFDGEVLNLGCGTGDETFRFLHRYPKSRVIGVDGAAAMIARAKLELATHHKALSGRAEFLVGYVPSEEIPRRPYVAVLSNSLLHHMHKASAFWGAVGEQSSKGTAVFVGDLRRPDSKEKVEELVRVYTEGEPEIFRGDFRNSLCAAFTADEVRSQLKAAGLSELKVREIGDRYLVIAGVRG